MNIIYFDETGNTGSNLADGQQPVFVLAALVVPESEWLDVERDLQATLDEAFPPPRPEGFEIHATTLRNASDASGYFKQFTVSHRIAFRDEWIAHAENHGLRLIYRAIVKSRFHRWVQNTFGSGLRINPHIVAFPLVAQVVNEYLQSCAGNPLGIFVFDENKEVVHDVEKSLRVLRGIENSLRLGRIIEKGFFIDSAKSLMLQLCDICAYSARKKEEDANGMGLRAIDEGGVKAIEPLIYRGHEAWQDVLAWITAQQKKERPGA